MSDILANFQLINVDKSLVNSVEALSAYSCTDKRTLMMLMMTMTMTTATATMTMTMTAEWNIAHQNGLSRSLSITGILYLKKSCILRIAYFNQNGKLNEFA